LIPNPEVWTFLKMYSTCRLVYVFFGSFFLYPQGWLRIQMLESWAPLLGWAQLSDGGYAVSLVPRGEVVQILKMSGLISGVIWSTS
jgi:hypothetical protein